MYVLCTPKWIIQAQGKARWWNAGSWCCLYSWWLSCSALRRPLGPCLPKDYRVWHKLAIKHRPKQTAEKPSAGVTILSIHILFFLCFGISKFPAKGWHDSQFEMKDVRMLPVTPIIYPAAANQNFHRARSSPCSIHVNHPATDAAECLLDTTNPGCQLQLYSKTGTPHQRE